MTTMVIVSFGPSDCKVCGGGGGRAEVFGLACAWASSDGCSGRKLEATTALGMTDTMSGSREARRTVFSLQVWLTQMTWSTSLRVNLSNLLVKILAASAKPKRL